MQKRYLLILGGYKQLLHTHLLMRFNCKYIKCIQLNNDTILLKLFHSNKLSTMNYTNLKLIFYCEKYTYHFLTIAICWCHPTHWPTLRNVLSYLKKPVSECGSRKPPNGHVTTPIGAIHCFCWPSMSVDVYLKFSFFL